MVTPSAPLPPTTQSPAAPLPRKRLFVTAVPLTTLRSSPTRAPKVSFAENTLPVTALSCDSTPLMTRPSALPLTRLAETRLRRLWSRVIGWSLPLKRLVVIVLPSACRVDTPQVLSRNVQARDDRR